MRFYSTYLSTHTYKYLPGFAQFLLENHLDTLVREQLQLASEVDLPLLKHLKHLSVEELFQLSKISMREYLQMLADNKGQEQIEQSLTRWKADELIIGKSEPVAEDITLINFIRGKSMRSFIPLYNTDVRVFLLLVDELDSFLTGSTTASMNTYISILKDEIARHEKELLKAQAIAEIGSFEWNMITHKTNNSPQVYEIFEVKPGIGFNAFMENIHPEDREKVKKELADSLKTGNYETEYRYLINNKVKFIWSKGIVVYDADGKPEKLIGTIQDITKRKEAERELYEKTIALEKSNSNLEQFAYAASHDLKEPIRKVNYFCDRLKSTLLPRMKEAEVELFDKMEKATERMRLLIDDLLEYSHVSLEPKELEEINLNEKVNNVLDDLAIAIKEKNAVIKKGPLPTVKGHRRQLQQLFQNIIGNALKYSKQDVQPVIEISSREVDRKTISQPIPGSNGNSKFHLIEIRDNGIGFEPENSERIFQVFQRLHTNQQYKGTGVGLSIARKVVENHKGVITAESQPGKGAIFKVYMPVEITN